LATRGRKPLPTALKVLEGDRGKGRRPLNKNEPKPPKGTIKCPTWLVPEAKKEWKRLAPSLEAMGLLTIWDIDSFSAYCQAYARWREAEEFITQHGSIFKTPSGYVQQEIAGKGYKNMACCAERFGLNPLLRSWNLASHIGSSTCRIHC